MYIEKAIIDNLFKKIRAVWRNTKVIANSTKKIPSKLLDAGPFQKSFYSI